MSDSHTDTDDEAGSENDPESTAAIDVDDGPADDLDDHESDGRNVKRPTPEETAAEPTATAEPATDTGAGAPVETFDAPSGIQLLEGEEVLHDLRPSWANYPKSLWATALTIWFVVGAVFLVYPFLDRRNERYVVTSDRVIHRSGLMSTTTNEYRIADIRGLQTGQSFTEKIFSSGNIQFTAAGGTITFSGVPDAPQVANTIRRQKAELE